MTAKGVFVLERQDLFRIDPFVAGTNACGEASKSLSACAAAERGRPRGLITPIILTTRGSVRLTATSLPGGDWGIE